MKIELDIPTAMDLGSEVKDKEEKIYEEELKRQINYFLQEFEKYKYNKSKKFNFSVSGIKPELIRAIEKGYYIKLKKMSKLEREFAGLGTMLTYIISWDE
jgi:hypothetical protein